jgi:hypothetical protein
LRASGVKTPDESNALTSWEATTHKSSYFFRSLFSLSALNFATLGSMSISLDGLRKNEGLSPRATQHAEESLLDFQSKRDSSLRSE